MNPEIDWATFPAPSQEEAAREIADMKARWMNTDHAEALRDHYAWTLEREDPEGFDRERRAQRRDAEQMAMKGIR
jgi:hypothetical protein